MAYPLSQVLPRSPVVPWPVSPVVRDGYRRRFVAVFAGTSLLWFFVFAAFAFVSVPLLVESDGSVIEMIMALTGASTGNAAALFMVGILAAVPIVGGACAGVASTKGYIRRWAGYRRRDTAKDTIIRGAGWIMAAPIAFGAVPGFLVIAVGSALRDELWTAAAEVVMFAAAAYAARHIGRRAAAVVARLQGMIDARDRIIAHGYHSVARVEKSRGLGVTVDGRSEFAVTLVSDYGGERSTIDIRIAEHPIWAPVPGTEFDVWTTEGHPLSTTDADRIVIERRYIEQDGPAKPFTYRNSSSEYEQRMAPEWVAAKPDAITRDVHGGRWRHALQVLALSIRFLGTFLALVIVGVLVASGATALAIGTFVVVWAISAVDTYLALARMRRARWYIRNRLPVWTVVPVWMTLPLLTAPTTVTDDVLYIGAGEAAELTAVGGLVLGLCGVFVVLSLFLAATAVYPPQLFNRGVEGSAEAIQQAMTSHDPTSADRLEAETGLRVGVALIRWEFVTV